ncbi:MAG: hypothetical protein K8U57_14525 [Planctomycetes bacterium]|nr:hypothetical protein [Planctomycetota bacterium]
MLIRFNRSSTVREAYSLYDLGDYSGVIKLCSKRLKEANPDPELRLLRGVAYLDLNKPNEAVADWEACCQSPHIAGVAHLYLGNFLSTKLIEYHGAAWDHFTKAIESGWVEGHTGRGSMLFDKACQCNDEGHSNEARKYFGEAVRELTLAVTSPAPFSKRRALSLRGDAYFHLGDLDSRARDRAAEKELPRSDEPGKTDERARGVEQYD